MRPEDAATQDVWRLFVAVDLPDDVKQRMQIIREVLQRAGWRGRWTKPETMHLTLRFFGNRPVESVRNLADELRSSVANEVTFKLRTGVMGAFPNARRPRVIWLGVGDPSGMLSRIASAIEQRSREMGLEPEERPFSPHLTVARVQPEDRETITNIDRHFEDLDRLKPLQIAVDHITLYRSELNRSGSIYTVVKQIDFEADT